MIDVENWPDDEALWGGDAPRDGVTCNRCGKSGLEWVDIGGAALHRPVGTPRYKLYDGLKPHRCKEADLHREIADDFDVLP